MIRYYTRLIIYRTYRNISIYKYKETNYANYKVLGTGARLGVVLSFMMGVTTLSLPSIIMLKKAVKPKLLGIFVAICTIGIIIVGYFFNVFQHQM